MASQEKVKTSEVEQETVTLEQETEKSVKQERLIEVKREKFGTAEDGVTPLYSYYIDVVLLGGKLRVSLAAKDNGNFQFLNLIYGDKNVCNGRIKVSSFLPEKSKVAIETIEVEVFVEDSDGDEICSTLYPQRKSDKDILSNYLKKLKRA